MKVFDQIDLNPRRPPVWLYWAITLILMLASLGLMADAWRRHSIQRALEEQQADGNFQAQLAAQKQALQRERAEQKLRELDEAVKPWLGAASFPWDELMLSLERVRLPGLRLQSLDVDAKQGVAKLAVECSDAEQAAEVVRLLDEGLPSDDRRWHLVRVQSKLGTGVEAELQFRMNLR